MSEYTQSSKRLLSFLKERPFLFRKGVEDFTIAEYLKWFEKRNEEDFYAYPAMLTYDAKIVDQYQKKVFNSAFYPLPTGALALHTVVQLSPKTHLIFIYTTSQDRLKIIAYCTVYSTCADEFFKFIDEASSYVVDDEHKVGFGSGFGTNDDGFTEKF